MDTNATVIWIYVLWGVFLVQVVLSILVGRLAQKKGYSFGGFFAISFFLSFILGLIIVLVISPKPESQMSVSTSIPGLKVGPVSCPYCKELIRPDAVVCKHCGKDVEPVLQSSANSNESLTRSAVVVAPNALKANVRAENPKLFRKLSLYKALALVSLATGLVLGFTLPEAGWSLIMTWLFLIIGLGFTIRTLSIRKSIKQLSDQKGVEILKRINKNRS